MHPITGLLTALGALTVFYVAAWGKYLLAARQKPGGDHSPATDGRFPTPFQILLGAVTNFFDSLGIGSFATTTAVFKLKKMVPDRIIPGTLNAGHTLPTIVQAFVFTQAIPVDVLTLFLMIAAAVLGAWLGAGIVAKWDKRKVQFGMGSALLAAAVFMLMTQLKLFPSRVLAVNVPAAAGQTELRLTPELEAQMYSPVAVSVRRAGTGEHAPLNKVADSDRSLAGDEWMLREGRVVMASVPEPRDVRIDAALIGVRDTQLALAVLGNFLLGALMTLGIGLYAPCMILVSLLGMSEPTAFPIMMGSCAFLMPVGSLRFIREQSYSLRNALGLALGGIVGVVLAVTFFRTLDIRTVRWLVIVVVLYTGITMLLAAMNEKPASATQAAKA